MATHTFVISWLDYCNSLYVDAPQSFVSCLQLARLLTGKSKYQTITLVLISLHWLPVKYRIDFKIMFFKSLHNQAPQYLTDLLQPYTSSEALLMICLFVLFIEHN